MAEYRFITTWQIEAPLDTVFNAIAQSLDWPDWWQGAEKVEQRAAGDANGIGSVRRYTWKSRLPYRLVFDARTTRIEPPAALEAVTSGDLEGSGRWLFSYAYPVTTVRYEWHVRTRRWWMNLLAPAARFLFEKNHHALMRCGAQGLARLLRARLVGISYTSLPPTPQPAKRRLHAFRSCFQNGRDLAIAIYAGIAAGSSASGVQIALWWANSDALPQILWRDARLTAAIVMGPGVLPPPADFEWSVMLAATLVHFTLSISYSLLLACLIAKLDRMPSLLTGSGFGLLLYAINMYGFTLVFPWFEAARGGITATAHIAFGITVAALYRCRTAVRD